MLKKTKSKRRLTEPHISPAVLSLSVAQQGSGSGSMSVSGSPQSQSQQQLQQQQQQQQQQQLAENGEKEASMTLPAGFGST